MNKLMLKLTPAFLVILSGSSFNALIWNSAGGANNTLMLDGKATDETSLSSTHSMPTFREGKIVDADAFAHNNAVTEIEMSTILEMARYGDKIIIDPAGENAADNRRVIVVRQSRYIPQFDWWPGQPWRKPQQKGGC